jgi:hypothetical protein
VALARRVPTAWPNWIPFPVWALAAHGYGAELLDVLARADGNGG